MNRRLILASASPRRRELLQRVGYDFEVIACEEDEVVDPSHPALSAMAAALKKAECVGATIDDGVIIGADTIVVCNGRILNKPIDNDDARRMLNLLSGNVHFVYTGVAIIDTAGLHRETFFECSAVFFRQLDAKEIEEYIASEEPLDKAGAYGIQELGACFVKRIEGCYFNVVGLPVSRLCSYLSAWGIDRREEEAHEGYQGI